MDKRRLARAFVAVLTLLISGGSPWAGCLRADAGPPLGAHVGHVQAGHVQAGHLHSTHCEDRVAHHGDGDRPPSSCASACPECAAGPTRDAALAKAEKPVTDFLPLSPAAAPIHRWPVVTALPVLPRGGGLRPPAVTLFALGMLLLD